MSDFDEDDEYDVQVFLTEHGRKTLRFTQMNMRSGGSLLSEESLKNLKNEDEDVTVVSKSKKSMVKQVTGRESVSDLDSMDSRASLGDAEGEEKRNRRSTRESQRIIGNTDTYRDPRESDEEHHHDADGKLERITFKVPTWILSLDALEMGLTP